MSNYQNYQPSNDDTAASTQMFRAFVEEPAATPATAPSESRHTGVIAAAVIIGLVVVIGVVYLAFK
ncbi:hypothetical protein DN069_24545 [Streptacidiphilus pinicola]|uniref:Uncharacterized protein n=1 Tax=Streptacidiphilus pinicola TaxID=2219663 RepID=A0A2X0IDH8_9ACTN|nr:hypothetical protein [Streptacidiphilus pinicola]RAG83044.1 hypothetical protein DN069_24545 [Streptacidiphilus pinicola]